MRRLLVLAFVQLAAVATGRVAFGADYGSAGPLHVTTSSLPANEGGSTGGYVVVPDGAGPYPLVIASHGWSASADQQVGWAQHFASWGMVVVAPSFPNPLTPSDQTDAQIIESLAKLYADPSHASPAQGKVDGARVGLEGHSAGGLATTLASASIHPQAVVLFDPVDSNSDGKNALAAICSPVLGVFANPSSCNNQEGWWPYANTTAGAEVLFHVVNSTHCDGENTSRALCGSFCGGAADATRQLAYSRYATAFLLAHLAGDANAAATLTMASLSADTALTSVIVKGGAPCDASSDAGAGTVDSGGAPADAGAIDATTPHDAGLPLQDGSSSGPSSDGSAAGRPEAGGGIDAASSGDAPTPSNGGGGCACATAPGGGTDEASAIGLAVAFAAARWTRRRPRVRG